MEKMTIREFIEMLGKFNPDIYIECKEITISGLKEAPEPMFTLTGDLPPLFIKGEKITSTPWDKDKQVT